MKIGCQIPIHGAPPVEIGISEMARRAEAAGFDNLWVGDHIALPRDNAALSRYPYGATTTSQADEPWFDAIVAMGQIVSATQRCEVGVGVLVLALRDPVVLAKQVATLDVLSAGRIVLGIGSGWLQPEFDLLGVDFEGRGARTDEGIALVRQCWTGTLDRHGSQVFTTPRPAREVPVVIGGISSRALARAGRVGDGWFAVQQASRAEPSEIERGMASIGAARQRRGRSGKSRTIVYVSRSAHDLGSVARLLPMYRDLGVDDMVVDVDWRDKGCPKSAAEILGIGS